MKSMFRTGWQMDYPSIENFLAPIYGDRCGLERRRLLQPGVRQAPRRGCGCHDPAAANAKYQEAEALLAKDMPVIPMWYTKSTMGWSEKVATVKITAFGTIDLTSVTLK